MGKVMGALAHKPGKPRENDAKGNSFHALGAQTLTQTSLRPSVTNPAFLAGSCHPFPRRTAPGRGRLRAFTLLELMVILTITVLLVALLIPATIKSKAKSQRIKCVSNLKLVGLSIRIFSTDHKDRFPWDVQTNAPPLKTYDDFLKILLTATNEIAYPSILACPADTRKRAHDWTNFSRLNVSYFFSPSSAETYPQSFLAGDRNLMTNGVRLQTGIVKILPGSEVSWDSDMHRYQGNAAMGDGSIQQLSAARLREQLKITGTAETTLAIP
jgi:type II secretory pathway pseudopilin PulG